MMQAKFAGWLRMWADRIDDRGAPKITHWSFTFEQGEGVRFREDGKGCPLAYLGDDQYERAHSEADSAAPPPKRDLDDPVVRATNPPSMAVRVDDVEIVLPRSHPLFSRIDLVAERGRELVVIPGEPDHPDRPSGRPPLPAGCEFLAYVHVHHGAACIMDCHIETDVPVYQEDR